MIKPDLGILRKLAQDVRQNEGRRGGSVSAHTLALEAATLIAWAENLETKLAEATAVIICAQDECDGDEYIWRVLDGYDGSEDAVRYLKDCGYQWMGDGWHVQR